MSSPVITCDVLVVGSGNAGFSAAVSASQSGADKVILIDKCSLAWAGGNTYFTAGAFRTSHAGLSDLLPLVNNVDAATAKLIDIDPYPASAFAADMSRVTSGRTDAILSKILVEDSNDAVKWLSSNGIRFQLSFNRQAYHINGRYKFWGGLALKTPDGGKGLVADHQAAAARHGINVLYDTPAMRLITQNGAVSGVLVAHQGAQKVIQAKAVILAAGGFEANPQMRSQYLGPGWDLAHVRGTPHNTGDGLEMAVRDAGAAVAGNWSGCHSTAWDANAPAHSGDREISNEFTKSGYPLGLMINVNGQRFVDEGVDLRNFTYAKFGRAILEQPEGSAFQVWDSSVLEWLRSEEYRDEIVEKIWGETVEELAEKCEAKGLNNKEVFVRTIRDYNDAVYQHRKENPSMKWNPAVKDGLSTQSNNRGLALPKSNWSLPLDKGPFLAVKVGCGITFTFGGLKVNPRTAAVISSATGIEIPRLFAVGEMLGGLFYGNYPGGSGLTSGAVFGRSAGREAARVVMNKGTSSRL